MPYRISSIEAGPYCQLSGFYSMGVSHCELGEICGYILSNLNHILLPVLEIELRTDTDEYSDVLALRIHISQNLGICDFLELMIL